jgi:citrate synthase
MDTITTAIWQEEPEPANPFAARVARCRGYDVFGQMLGRAGWADMIFLLFAGEAPSPAQKALLEALAVALANPGPRDPSVHAAMCGGVGRSPAAACLMAALGVGAGRSGGAREVFRALQAWHLAGGDGARLRNALEEVSIPEVEVWPEVDLWPGFDPHAPETALPVRQTLEAMATLGPGPALPALLTRREELEVSCGRGLHLAGVAAAAYFDLGLGPEQGEMLHLLLRLPGAAVHALEQQRPGYKKFPFGAIELLDDPAAQARQVA